MTPWQISQSTKRDRSVVALPAFTLIELLVVISIVALLIAVLLPSLKAARVASRRTASLSNIRQITIAQHAYANEHDGLLTIMSYDDRPPGSMPAANYWYWPAMFMQGRYLESRKVYWSPARDTSNIDINRQSLRVFDPWRYSGYGLNVWAAGRLNLNHRGTPDHDKFLLLAETFSPAIGVKAGWFEAEAKTTGAYQSSGIFTYDGVSISSYVDGHAKARPSLELRWRATNQQLGSWVLASSGVRALEPWYYNWWQ